MEREAENVGDTAQSPSWTRGQVRRPGTHEGPKLRTEGKKPLRQQRKDQRADVDGEPREGDHEVTGAGGLNLVHKREECAGNYFSDNSLEIFTHGASVMDGVSAPPKTHVSKPQNTPKTHVSKPHLPVGCC